MKRTSGNTLPATERSGNVLLLAGALLLGAGATLVLVRRQPA